MYTNNSVCVKPSKEDPMSHLATEENVFQYLSELSIIVWLVLWELNLCASITDCYCYPASYIQCALNSFVPHGGGFFIKQLGNLESFLPDPWQSNVVTNLIKPLIQLNPIMQISVFRAVKILSGNLNVVRILNAWWLTFGFRNLLLWVTFCKQGSSWKSVDFKINFPRLCS